MSTPTLAPPPAPATITAEMALAVARVDGEKAYRDLSRYRIEISLESDGWHVEYHVKGGPMMKGGGPHYVINNVTGEIVSKVYYQ